MNVWTDETAVERWRNVMQHRMSQKEGREKLFESYKITVCSEIRSYTDTDRAQAPQDSNQYFECGGLIMQYTSHYRSPMGDILLAADEIGLTGLWFEGQKYFALYLDKEHEEKEIPLFEKVKQWLDYLLFREKSRTLLYRFILQAQTFKMRCGKSSVPFHTARR